VIGFGQNHNLASRKNIQSTTAIMGFGSGGGG